MHSVEALPLSSATTLAHYHRCRLKRIREATQRCFTYPQREQRRHQKRATLPLISAVVALRCNGSFDSITSRKIRTRIGRKRVKNESESDACPWCVGVQCKNLTGLGFSTFFSVDELWAMFDTQADIYIYFYAHAFIKMSHILFFSFFCVASKCKIL